MGATNKTTYYELSQFIGTDKPAWLQDYNGDMLKIDTGINAAKVAADNAANAASAAQGDATTALGGVSSLNTTVGTISSTLGTAVGNINTINSLIGNGTPTTTDQTIIGAINELHTDVLALAVGYSLDEINKTIASVTADGVKTRGDLFQELALAVVASASALGNNKVIEARHINMTGFGTVNFVENPILNNGATSFQTSASYSLVLASGIYIENLQISTISASNRYFESVITTDPAVTITDKLSEVPTAGSTLSIIGNIWRVDNLS